MKRWYFGIICLLGLFLAACGEEELPLPYEAEVQYEVHPQAQFLEDLDYLFHILENNFPLLNAAQRNLGIDVDELKADMHQRTYNGRWNNRQFQQNLHSHFVNHFGGFGHFFLLDDWFYHLILHVLPDSPWTDVLDNPASRNIFGMMEADFGQQGEFVAQENVHAESVEEGRIARIAINSFMRDNITVDREIILPFLESVADYEHLIIDIRGNGGGSSSYFPQNFMQYLIDQPLTYHYHFFTMDGDHVRRFYNAKPLPWNDISFNPISYGFVAELPYLHPDDAGFLRYYATIESTIHPSDYAVGFNGKIWLLVDGRNFSAADYAATIARQTGFATIVGEPTGGAGIGVDPIVFVLPNTGIAGRFQGVYSTDSLGRNGYEFVTQPDILNRQGMDALATVLALIEEGDF
ncbi:MAG: S41 family peptidase [Defluviitaleaceae bacterium]|nr:S41 family peptidase [Defluviitaleaceae bacterium]